MHTTSGPAGTHFIHNGDYSGAVIFDAATVDGDRVDGAAPFSVLAAAVAGTGADAATVTVAVAGNGHSFAAPYTEDRYDVVVPAADLRHLVAERARSERIAALEDADADELFESVRVTELVRWSSDVPDWT